MNRVFAINRPLLLTFAALAGVVIASSGTAKEPHEGTWRCYWVHGRMTIGNGTPAVRIWPRGSHRLLGVINPKMDYDAGGMLPYNVKNMMAASNNYTVWGEFHVCPTVPDRPGWMRFVTIDGARKLFTSSKN